MIGVGYKEYVIGASYLFPPSLADFLGPGDEVHILAEVTEHLDISSLDSDFNGMGIRSSRRIAPSLEREVGFRVVAANAAFEANRSYEAIEEEVRRMLRRWIRRRTPGLALSGRVMSYLKGWGACRKPMSRLEEEAEVAARAVQEHVEQRQMEEADSGKKKRGRKPKVIEFTPTAEAKAAGGL